MQLHYIVALTSAVLFAIGIARSRYVSVAYQERCNELSKDREDILDVAHATGGSNASIAAYYAISSAKEGEPFELYLAIAFTVACAIVCVIAIATA